MRLYPLDPASRTANNMFELSRKLGIKREVIVEKADYLKSVVIIANGSPEDYVLVLLAYHENGRGIAGVIKPPNTRLSAIDIIPTLAKTKANKLLFMIDQEDERIDNLFSLAEDKLREKFNIKLLYKDTKLREYECKRNGMSVCWLIFVVNGLDDVETERHTIEDHLVRAAEKLGIIQIREACRSTKDVWKSLGKDQHHQLFKSLKNSKQIMEYSFPQQLKGVELLSN